MGLRHRLAALLMIENSQQQRATGAAVESFRNEMVRLNQNGAAHAIEHHPQAVTPSPLTA